MKAETPTSVDVTVPVGLPMAIAVAPPAADLCKWLGVVRIESRAVFRPVLSLLRQHCALTV